MQITSATSHNSNFTTQALPNNQSNHESQKATNHERAGKTSHDSGLKTSHNSSGLKMSNALDTPKTSHNANGGQASNSTGPVTGHKTGAVDILA